MMGSSTLGSLIASASPAAMMADASPSALITATSVTTLALMLVCQYALWGTKPVVYPGPLRAMPRVSKADLEKATYKPDHFPGGRDVDTPYGTIRVYEFGPEDGRKVLFVHGISTSSMTMGYLARPLAEKGCRVMLFDIFGRGFSDAPGDVKYDTRLFTTQILLVLASSKLAWTGNNGFHLLGYSLGGGIAANFAATFPDMVETLLLLAPAGVIRAENFGGASRTIFQSGIIPDRILGFLTKIRLRKPIDNAVSKKRRASTSITSVEGKESVVGATAVTEAVHTAPEADVDQEPGSAEFEQEVIQFIHWSLDHSEGFVPAFMSTIRFAPLIGQHEYWRKLAKRRPGTTAVLLGRHDELIQRDDYMEDAVPLLGGPDNIFLRVVPGAHNFPFTHYTHALKVIDEFWAQSPSP